jgi:hypothetical protein
MFYSLIKFKKKRSDIWNRLKGTAEGDKPEQEIQYGTWDLHAALQSLQTQTQNI